MAQKKLTDAFVKSVKGSKSRKEFYDTVVSGLCLRVTKKGTKTFSYEYKFNGNRRRLSIGRYDHFTLKDARDKCKEAKVQINKGIDPKAEIDARKKNTESTVDDVIKRYKAEYLPSLAKKTRVDYKRYLDKRISKSFGPKNVKAITKKELVEFIDSIALKEGYKVTANRVQATLSGLFTFAEQKSYIDLDPTKGISKKKETSKDRVYTDHEVNTLWNYFENMQAPTGQLYQIILLYARRKTETMKLKWENVDLEKKSFTIIKDDEKNSRTLTLPITPKADKIFKDLKKYSKDSSYVFQSPRIKNKPISSDSYARQKIQNSTAVDDFTPHDLRRTAITLLSKNGAPKHVAKKIANQLKGDSDDVFYVYNRYEYFDEMKTFLIKYHEYLNNIIK